MDAEAQYDRPPSLVDADNWLALGAGAVLLLVGVSRRSIVGACLAVWSAPCYTAASPADGPMS